MGKTEISWADETWNPMRGCTRVSEGCRHCYAETTAARFSGPGQPYEGLVTRKLKVISDDEQRMESRWTGDVRFIASALADPLKRKKPTRYFVNSMSDLFYDGFSNEQIAAVFGVMAACPQHTFMVLTKRPQRMREWFEWIGRKNLDELQNYAYRAVPESEHAASMAVARGRGNGWPLSNAWIGVSVEHQAAADERIPELLATPAAVRFLSCEPLLGPVDLRGWGDQAPAAVIDVPEKLHWVIAGCESGAGARPCEVEWLRSLRDQCTSAGVAFWLKQAKPQLGASTLITTREQAESRVQGKLMGTIPIIGEGPGSKRKAGGIIELPYLDGVQHAAFPEVARG